MLILTLGQLLQECGLIIPAELLLGGLAGGGGCVWGVGAGLMNRGWRCVQWKRVSSQSLQSRQEKFAGEGTRDSGSPVIQAPELHCKHADHTLQLTGLLSSFLDVLGEFLPVFLR